jgi:transposase
VISMALFQTIREWHSQGVSKREMSRRLGIDIKTVRRIVAKIETGAQGPVRQPSGSKLDAYADHIVSFAASGRTAWSIYVALREDPAFVGSYELVKKRVAQLRKRDPRVFERLDHAPGAEMQADFGELCRVCHQGQRVRCRVAAFTISVRRGRSRSKRSNISSSSAKRNVRSGIRS